METPSPQPCPGTLAVVGIGPGSDEHITPAALAAITQADLVVGYSTYIKLVKHLLEGKTIVKTGMTEEISRARSAIEQARDGRRVVLISSGDAGVYGMCSLVFQVLQEIGWQQGDSPTLQIIPGMTALNACGSLVGAPFGHDFCSISLSDLLTPWPLIARRIEAAAAADFAIALYNPKSGRRTQQIVTAQAIISRYRASDTPVALVKSAYRSRQHVVLSDLSNFLEHDIGMLTTVLVGASSTYVYAGYMVTPRGYTNKYTLQDGQVLEGQQPARSLRYANSTEKESPPQ